VIISNRCDWPWALRFLVEGILTLAGLDAGVVAAVPSLLRDSRLPFDVIATHLCHY
jgi:hypothetical protein